MIKNGARPKIRSQQIRKVSLKDDFFMMNFHEKKINNYNNNIQISVFTTTQTTIILL